MSRSDEPGTSVAEPAQRTTLGRALTAYSASRVLLVVAVAAFLYYVPRIAGVQVPFLLAALLALVLQLPMAWLLLPGQRATVTELLAARGSDRKNERERLRAALRGDDRDAADLPGAGSPGNDDDADGGAVNREEGPT